MATNSDDELQRFKRDISLPEYAVTMGYVWNQSRSSRSSVTMEKAAERIVITKDEDAHWVYFNVADVTDSGSIIDFVQHRGGGNLGLVRQRLRPWIGGKGIHPGRPAATSFPAEVLPTPRDTSLVAQQITALPVVTTSPYLEQERALPGALLTSPRFAGCIFQDATGKLCFPHQDTAGICGAEIRSHSFKGFSPGGRKGLWHSHRFPGDTTLVMTESAIDSLSYHALHHLQNTCYISVAGGLAPQQHALLTNAVSSLPRHGKVILATDHDTGGNRLADTLEQIIATTQRADLQVVRHTPPTPGQDWNDVLRERTHGQQSTAHTQRHGNQAHHIAGAGGQEHHRLPCL